MIPRCTCGHAYIAHDRWGIGPCNKSDCKCRQYTAEPATAEARPQPTDDDRAKAIVAMSKAIHSDRLTIGHAISLVAQLLADQRADIHASYEVVAKAQRESCEQWWQEANGAEEPDLSYARGRQHAADQAAYAIRQVASK